MALCGLGVGSSQQSFQAALAWRGGEPFVPHSTDCFRSQAGLVAQQDKSFLPESCSSCPYVSALMTLVCLLATPSAQSQHRPIPPTFSLFQADDPGADSLHRADLYPRRGCTQRESAVTRTPGVMALLLTSYRFPCLAPRLLACHLSCYGFSSSSVMD